MEIHLEARWVDIMVVLEVLWEALWEAQWEAQWPAQWHHEVFDLHNHPVP